MSYADVIFTIVLLIAIWITPRGIQSLYDRRTAKHKAREQHSVTVEVD